MEGSVLENILKGIEVPEFIYRHAEGSVYFTRPGISYGFLARGMFHGYDTLTHLPQYDREDGIPMGANLYEIDRGVYAGWRKRSHFSNSPSRITPHQFPIRAGPFVHPEDERHWLTPGSKGTTYPSLSRFWRLRHLFARRRNKPAQEPVQSPQPELERPKDSPVSAYKSLMDALDRHYAKDLKAEVGHHFDNVDDNVIIAYARAHETGYDSASPDLSPPKIIGSKWRKHDSWLIPVPYLYRGLNLTFLDVILPLDRRCVRDLSNDVLRVLHIQLAAADYKTPYNHVRASDDDMVESRLQVLGELMRRGFTGRLPNVVRLKGLGRGVSFNISEADVLLGLGNLSHGPDAVALEANGAGQIGAPSDPTGGPNVDPGQQVREQAPSTGTDRFDETLVEIKGEDTGVRGQETELYDHSGLGITLPNSLQPIHEEGVLEENLTEDAGNTSGSLVAAEGAGNRAETTDVAVNYVPESYISMTGEIILHSFRR